MPDGLSLGVSFDRATYINAAIWEVYKTLAIAFVLVVIIIYLFLGNIKAVIVPAVALPVSLISSFLGLWIFDLSINIFVLLSFILAIGIITDDSVIMTDAIYHRVEKGENPYGLIVDCLSNKNILSDIKVIEGSESEDCYGWESPYYGLKNKRKSYCLNI